MTEPMNEKEWQSARAILTKWVNTLEEPPLEINMLTLVEQVVAEVDRLRAENEHLTQFWGRLEDIVARFDLTIPVGPYLRDSVSFYRSRDGGWLATRESWADHSPDATSRAFPDLPSAVRAVHDRLFGLPPLEVKENV